MDKSPVPPSHHEEFGLDDEHVGASFHRFQAVKAIDFPAAAKHFAEFQSALTRRMQWEDEQVFPQFLQRVGGKLENTCDALQAEHREIARLLDTIAVKLAQGNPGTEAEESALQKLLAAHNHWEHRVVFPALE